MASFTMDKEILGSVPALSLAFSNKKKLPHYHKGIEMGFTFKEELFKMKLNICYKKSVI